jgi:competence protein ComEC
MAVWDPYLVLYDLSYQLSVLSTLGLTLFADSVQKKILFVPETAGFREIVSATVATQLTVLPLLIFSTGQVSIVSLFTNILVLPTIPLAMLMSFIAALLGLFSYALAFPFTALAYAILHYIITTATWFGNLPFAAVQVSFEATSLTLSVLAFIYAAAFLAFAMRRNVFLRRLRSGS